MRTRVGQNGASMSCANREKDNHRTPRIQPPWLLCRVATLRQIEIVVHERTINGSFSRNNEKREDSVKSWHLSTGKTELVPPFSRPLWRGRFHPARSLSTGKSELVPPFSRPLWRGRFHPARSLSTGKSE